MANLVYNIAKGALGDGTIDWDTGTIKCMLVDGYVADDAHTSLATSVTPSEITGTGYTATGNTLTCSVVVDQANNQAEYDAVDTEWTASTITADGAVVYSGDIPICYLDFGGDKISSDGTFTIQFHADGVFTLA